MPNKCLKQKSYASRQRDISRGTWRDFIEKRASIQLKAGKPRREWREDWRRQEVKKKWEEGEFIEEEKKNMRVK